MLLLKRHLIATLVLAVLGLSAAGVQAGPASQPASRPARPRPASRPVQPASRPAGIKPARMGIQFQNRMGRMFQLVKLEVALDGILLYRRTDTTGALDRSRNLLVFEGTVAPVAHRVTLKLVYRGRSMGLFTYRRRYVYTLRDARAVPAVRPGGRTTVIVRGHMRGNIFWRVENRLAVGFEVKEQR